MSGNSRISDLWIGVCKCHDDEDDKPMIGPIIEGSTDVMINGVGAARIFDKVRGECGHYGYIIKASLDAKCNGKGMARQFDDVTGCTVGKILTCSHNSKTN